MKDILRTIAIPAAVAAAVLGMASLAEARVTKITIESKTSFANGQVFDAAGAYELIRGTAFGEIDPADRRNAGITDITNAPKNANGKVEYKAQFSIHKPVDMTKASGVLLYDVPNRGGITIPYGQDLVFPRGDVVLNSAWQGDQPIALQPASALGIDVPIATGVTGMVVDRFIQVAPQANGSFTNTQSLTGPGRDLGNTTNSPSTLISATRETPAGVKSGVVTIPSSDFAYADCRTVAFPGTPDTTRLCLKNGFDPALLYELVRPAKDPYVLGAGNAAMRDVISFFRRQAKDDAGTANPIAGLKYSIGFGNSQSGRFMKHMINNGFNEDENGQMVWDGINPNIAGMMGSFNIRFMQPGDIAELYFPGADGPIWWEDYEDKVRGRPAVGLLTRCRQTATCPLVMDTFGGPEMYYSHGGVGMVGTDAKADIPLPSNVRRYYHTSTPHGGGNHTFVLGTASTNPNQLVNNPNGAAQINRALYVAMVDWVTKGIDPPPSQYPKIANGTMVPATAAGVGWPAIPNTPTTDGVINPVLDYDFGSQFRYRDGSGVITTVPPLIKQSITMLAPILDSDGNELGGVRSVMVRVPLGTYVSWNPIPSGPLKGREASLAGGYVPFARFKADRLKTGDPRPSIEERYGSPWVFYFLIVAEADRMVTDRMLLPQDAQAILQRAFFDVPTWFN